MVHTENGLARIEDLKVGDQVLTFNEQTQKQEYKPILVTHQRYTMQMSGLDISGGEMLRVTTEHRFYTNGEWIEARALQAGDLLQNKDGDYVTILSIETVPHYEKVYNFDVQDNENYYVTEEGLLVHNGYNGNKVKVKKVKDQPHSVEITISKSDYPETTQHIEDAIKRGKPDIVTIQRNLAKENRANSLRGVDTKPKLDRDEWPMAMFKEGGIGADIKHINTSDNRGQEVQ